MLHEPRTLHGLFEQHAKRLPDREALIWANGRLTYSELDAHANQLARMCAESGVRTDARIGVALPRDGRLVVALLAVLKLGASYVPLDPDYPVERLAFMLEDAGCALLIADTPTGAKLRQHGCTCPQLSPLSLADELEVHESPPFRDVDPHDLAYVIYTSGSTGRPKGVAIEHRSAVALVEWAHRTFSAEDLSGMMACTSICFDLSVFEIFAPLCNGGRVVLLENALALADSAIRERVRFVNTVPSVMRELLRIEGVPRSVTTVCLAGEVFPASLVQQLGRHSGIRRVINAYGPTEDTTYSTWSEVDLSSSKAPTIGRPLMGTYVRVLDAALAPCAPGEPGELCLGGIGLARGYLNRVALTAERFIRDAHCDPDGDAKGARLYRTGDRVRMRDDGQLEYIDRLDRQIKLRGFRIELGEIERALDRQAGVDECAAIVVSAGPGDDQRIAAYYTGTATPETVRGGLRRVLPTFMMPSAIVSMPTLPRTLNGKCDRKRLPTPAWRVPNSVAKDARSSVETERSLEDIVVEAWREALGLDEIPRDHSFFALGGHSLLATRIVAQLRMATGRALRLSNFFRHPTVADCARALARAPTATAPRVPARVHNEAPLSSTQRQIWYMSKLDPETDAYNQACLIRLHGRVEPERMRRALAAVIRAQPGLRISIVERRGGVAQRVADHVELDLPCRVLDVASRDADAAIRRKGLQTAKTAFKLGHAPLMRAELFQIAPEDWGLVLVLHHLIFDEWSLSILVQQLARAYASEQELVEPTLRFLDACAEWHTHDWSQELERASGEFADVPPSLSLSTDKDHATSATHAGERLVATLDTALGHSLSELAVDAGVTEFMLLLAVFQLVLHEASGQSRFLTLTAASGRDSAGSDEVIGCFINMIPIRADVDGNEPFPDLLARVSQRCAAALDRQHLPLDQLAKRLHWTPSTVRVAFGIQNAPSAVAKAGGIHFRGSEIRNEATRIPLSVWIDSRHGQTRIEWTYRADLFKPAVIEGLQQRYAALLRSVTTSHTSTVAGLLASDDSEQNEIQLGRKMLPKRLPTKLVPKTVGRGELTRLDRGWLGRALPSKVEAQVEGVNLPEWAVANRSLIEDQLSTAGGLLLRGFRVDGVADFRAFAKAISQELIEYSERSSPRTEVTDGVYTSTDHPADQPIVLHNEQSYTLNWPMRIGFYCSRPALRRGRTPIADSRRILSRLSPATVERFERLGVMYVRNYHDGISLPWSVAFQTGSRARVEAYCRSASMTFEWVGGERLRTKQVRPAIRVHPITGERSWFNHALFFHVTSLPEDVTRSLRAALAEEDLPYNTFYGDGTPICDETLVELRAAFDAETVSFDWQRGDVLMLDNMLVAHGREPFEGPREVCAVMVDPYQSQLSSLPAYRTQE